MILHEHIMAAFCFIKHGFKIDTSKNKMSHAGMCIDLVSHRETCMNRSNTRTLKNRPLSYTFYNFSK